MKLVLDESELNQAVTDYIAKKNMKAKSIGFKVSAITGLNKFKIKEITALVETE